MNSLTGRSNGISTVGLLIGVALMGISITGALKFTGISMRAQNDLHTENLVDQVNRIGEIMTVHLNRGGSYQNPDVEAKGIQLCSLQNQTAQCNGYQSTGQNFCVSIPTRVSRSGNDVITVTGFRLFKGVLAQRELTQVAMAQFDHGTFCKEDPTWVDLNNLKDFEFTNIRFCKFLASTPNQVTRHYDQDCDSVIENNPKSNMFWIAIFKAKIANNVTENHYEEARIIHLLNTTRVRVGS
nr:hypothetical protein [uncultured Limnobacter sp.]